MGATPLVPSLRKQRQVDLREFGARLAHRVPRQPGLLHRDKKPKPTNKRIWTAGEAVPSVF